jgi:hypothetical protein
MAVITATATINPATMAANWGPGVINNSNKWMTKALAPRVLFNADPTGSQTAWQNGVNAAIAAGRYSNGLTKTDMAAMANGIATYGLAAYSASGTQKSGNYAKKTTALATALTAVRNTVLAMPKGTPANNNARMVAWANGMRTYKGTI